MKEKSQYHVHTSGGLLSRQFIEKLRLPECREQYARASTFSVHGEPAPKPAELEKKITEAWSNLKGPWHGVSLSLRKYDISKARQKWILPFFEELGYRPRYLKKDTMVLRDDGEQSESFPFSHRGGDWEHAPIIHTVPPDQDLDERVAMGRGSKSPHDTLQTYLNHSKDEKWGMVTNGVILRVLRQYHHVYTKGYVEFDLEGIFEERLFSDFRALYRLVHPSRFVPDKDSICPLERFYKVSLAAGEKIGDKLRKNVKTAIEVLGNGFLTRELAEELSQDTEKAREYYQEVLHVIYRVMFLMFAEQRGMLPSRNSLYASAYSMTRLRERAEKAKRRDRHYDLWKGLLTTFKLIKEGVDDPESKMKIFGYNGSLFDEEKIQTLKELHCENTNILKAVGYLTYFEHEKTHQRISYVDLGVEEIGSIYESLLDFTPRVAGEDTVVEGVTYTKGRFFLDPRGAARKSTGSYYTCPQLVNELIKSALKPVMEDRLKEAEDKEQALLYLKVCDPAMGSGAFLIAATNFLGKELAKLRTGTEYPSEKEERRARRDVLQHSIYGIDLNPMAVELAKVSLWIDACVEDMPLNFLDHHLKCGNSLLGATAELLEKGIPTEAYSLKGMDKETKELVKKIRTMNKEQLKERVTRIDADFWEKKEEEEDISSEFEHLSDLPEVDSTDVDRKKQDYEKLIHCPGYEREKFRADVWTAAFFWPVEELKEETEALTQADFKNLNILLSGEEKRRRVEELAEEYRFFHWHLEFPDVFAGEDGGFDCVLGNPPWEHIKISEQEWFFQHDHHISDAPNAASRKRMIAELEFTRPTLFKAWNSARQSAENMSNYARKSGKFPLCGRGDVRTDPLFSELFLNLVSRKGRAGFIVQTNIATGETTKLFFGHIVSSHILVSLYDFINSNHLFPAVRPHQHFCLLTLWPQNMAEEADYAFFLTEPSQLNNQELKFKMSEKHIGKLNPNTKTLPVFPSAKHAEVAYYVYSQTPILVDEKSPSLTEWNVRFLRMFDMANDSHYFKTKSQLVERGAEKIGKAYYSGGKCFIPLFDPKMAKRSNHRAAHLHFSGHQFRKIGKSKVSIEELSNPDFTPEPLYWICEEEVNKKFGAWQEKWSLGFKDVTGETSTFLSAFSIIPRYGVSGSFPLLLADASPKSHVVLLGNLNSLLIEYILRLKLQGLHMALFVVKQLPVLSKKKLNEKTPWDEQKTILEWLFPRCFEMNYTSNDLKSFAEACGIMCSPFKWDQSRRFQLECEIDAAFFHLYSITREDTEFILDSLSKIKSRDEKQCGEYRTKTSVLKIYDNIALAIEGKQPYKSALDPPPGKHPDYQESLK